MDASAFATVPADVRASCMPPTTGRVASTAVSSSLKLTRRSGHTRRIAQFAINCNGKGPGSLNLHTYLHMCLHDKVHLRLHLACMAQAQAQGGGHNDIKEKPERERESK
eukprot:TRINITY_DN4308_c0_g2_i1.p1 TRINITY_DN4308_c0_g2~~TRINITY_DN4308_c0_g2_i1.p1  ORF type:complete len:109 (-),score=9.32 TRINITY_DN4308_c0_g2_i1:298-624(-)